MARIFIYSMLMVGVWMLLFFSGLSIGSTALLAALGISGGTIVSNVAAVVGILSLSAVLASIVIGTFTRQSVESSLVATFAGSLLTITCIDFISIINYFTGICPATSDCSFVGYLISFLFVVLWAGYVIAIVQWWRGNDL